MLAHQKALQDVLRDLFPLHNFITNVRENALLKSPSTGKNLEVDIVYPDLHLSLEFQDLCHYQSAWYKHNTLAQIQATDNIKKELLIKQGETLVQVPCWWDGSLKSLQSVIQFLRPDLLTGSLSVDMVPLNPPAGFLATEKVTLVSFPTLDTLSTLQPSIWWIGEKFDGIRCVWEPYERQLYSRHGAVLELYPAMNQLFGENALDGEIWSGRGSYNETQSVVKAMVDKANFSYVRVVCFDEPSQAMKSEAFENRYAAALQYFSAENPVVKVAARYNGFQVQDINTKLHQVVGDGGEGIILQQVFSKYDLGRSEAVFKVKATADQEALVARVFEDGSLLLQLTDGTQFLASKDECKLENTPAQGAIVTFALDNPTSQTNNSEDLMHLTHNPSKLAVTRIRTDLTWQDVMQNAVPILSHQSFFASRKETVASMPLRYLPDNSLTKMRAHMENLAQQEAFDPLVPENWYKLTANQCAKYKGTKAIIKHFNNSLIQTLTALFPELKFDAIQFSNAQKKILADFTTRRKLLEKFARLQGGDPLDTSFWYALQSNAWKNFKGMPQLLNYYNKSFTTALSHLFPELRFFANKFKSSAGVQWKDRKTHRKFFEKIAADNNFDPLLPEGWYTVTNLQIQKAGGGSLLKRYYNYSLIQALKAVFPICNFDTEKFAFVPKSYWIGNNFYNAKKLLEKVAISKHMDPLQPQTWQSISKEDVKQHKGGKTILSYFYNSVTSLVAHLFPNVSLAPEKLSELNVYWTTKQNRKQFFELFAAAKNFDPLETEKWYDVTLRDLKPFSGHKKVLSFYGGSLASALVDVYPDIGLNTSHFKNVTYVKKSL